MTWVRRFLLFAVGESMLGMAGFFGTFAVLGAGHVNDLSPNQSRWMGILLWWAFIAPLLLLVGTCALALCEELGLRRSKQLLWFQLAPLLCAALYSAFTWGAAQLIFLIA
jgi:hypothetical protein